MRATVEIRRSHTLPTGTDATYNQDGAAVVMEIRADLITDRGAELIAQMYEDALHDWQPKTQLRLVQGGLPRVNNQRGART